MTCLDIRWIRPESMMLMRLTLAMGENEQGPYTNQGQLLSQPS